MRIVEVPKKVVASPGGLVGHHVATVEDETNSKRYAFVEQWQPPWRAPDAPMVGWGVWEVSPTGTIDFSRVSDALSEVAAVVEKAGLKRAVPLAQGAAPAYVVRINSEEPTEYTNLAKSSKFVADNIFAGNSARVEFRNPSELIRDTFNQRIHDWLSQVGRVERFWSEPDGNGTSYRLNE
jgi:hypothetical protein